jgi:hypothetical protein
VSTLPTAVDCPAITNPRNRIAMLFMNAASSFPRLIDHLVGKSTGDSAAIFDAGEHHCSLRSSATMAATNESPGVARPDAGKPAKYGGS